MLKPRIVKRDGTWGVDNYEEWRRPGNRMQRNAIAWCHASRNFHAARRFCQEKNRVATPPS